jgi:tetratricopeptide (TPR) repeat protein
MANISEALALARQHHQNGRLQAAEQLYRRILQADPDQADAIHLLGVIAHQLGQPELAVEYMKRSIALNGQVADFHYNLAKVHHESGRLAEAIASYRHALALNPNSAETHHNLGNLYKDLGTLEEAAACFRRASELKPNFAEAQNNLGSVLRQQGRLDEAIGCYRRALDLSPGSIELQTNLAGAFQDQGKWEEAATCLGQALALNPGHAEAHLCLGNVFKEQARWDEAIACYRRAVEIKPGLVAAHNNLGLVFKEQGKLGDAVVCGRRAVELNPSLAEPHNNLGVALKEQGKLDEAAACYRRALDLQPDFAEAHQNLGVVFMDQGKLEEAVSSTRRAIVLKPDLAEARRNLGILLFLLGRYDEGWREYDYRLACAKVWRKLAKPRWKGERAEGQTILIHAEQGFGDAIQFARYLPMVHPRSGAHRVIIEAHPALKRLFDQSNGFDAEIVSGFRTEESALPPHDFQVAQMSLPLALGLFEPMPMSAPYLRADPEHRRQRRERLGVASGYRVGLVWAGNPKHQPGLRRSIPPAKLMPLLEVDRITFYSLQIGSPNPAAHPLKDLGLVELLEPGADFADTAALLAELDLVITIDTAVAHLAGAMTRPVWTLLPFQADWRWGWTGESTPWYPTMRLFRQPALGEWDAVVQCVAVELKRHANGE